MHTSTADWLLFNHERITGTRSEPIISRLVFAEDMLDATAGAYPFDPDSDLMREIAWIYRPYVEARMSEHLKHMTSGEMEAIIVAVGSNISNYTLGRAGRLTLDMSYDVVGTGNGWSLIRETGYYARTKLFHSDVRAFISVRELGNGRYAYSIGKMSEFIPFPILQLYDELNRQEGLSQNDVDRWGRWQYYRRFASRTKQWYSAKRSCPNC